MEQTHTYGVVIHLVVLHLNIVGHRYLETDHAAVQLVTDNANVFRARNPHGSVKRAVGLIVAHQPVSRQRWINSVIEIVDGFVTHELEIFYPAGLDTVAWKPLYRETTHIKPLEIFNRATNSRLAVLQVVIKFATFRGSENASSLSCFANGVAFILVWITALITRVIKIATVDKANLPLIAPAPLNLANQTKIRRCNVKAIGGVIGR